MWKVLIADDEPKIRRGLRQTIEGLGSAYRVVAEAEDGELALEAVREHDPDMVLVDIRMPILGGLELVAALEDLPGDRAVLVITGHDEFDYAHKALKLGVHDYLLKPVSKEGLAEALGNAAGMLELRRTANKYLTWSRAELSRTIDHHRGEFLRQCADGRLTREEMADHLAYLDLDIPPSFSLCACRCIEAPGSVMRHRPWQQKLSLLGLQSIVMEVADMVLDDRKQEGGFGSWEARVRGKAGARKGLPLFFVDDRDCVVGLLPETGDAQAREMAEVLGRISLQHLHKAARFALVPVPRGLEGLADAWEDLHTALDEHGEGEEVVARIQAYLDKHCHKPDLGLEQLASAMQLSPGYLSRVLKQKTSYSFVEFLNRHRIQRAVLLMNEPGIKMFELAQRVGYRSQHYFSRAFRKILGTAPSQYRRGSCE